MGKPKQTLELDEGSLRKQPLKKPKQTLKLDEGSSRKQPLKKPKQMLIKLDKASSCEPKVSAPKQILSEERRHTVMLNEPKQAKYRSQSERSASVRPASSAIL